MYGVSITNGSPRNHIWTLAGGTTDLSQTPTNLLGYNCPCADPINYRVLPPSFVGDNYYCESGNSGISYSFNYLYSSDPLWDGQQCEGECCSNGNLPHGSVWSFPTLQPMILKCVFVILEEVLMIQLFNYWKSTFSDKFIVTTTLNKC